MHLCRILKKLKMSKKNKIGSDNLLEKSCGIISKIR